MKLSYKRILLGLAMIMLCVFMIGCGDKKDPADKNDGKFNLDNYNLYQTYEFNETLDVDKSVTALKEAEEKLKLQKKYYYTQSIKGTSEQDYAATGEAIFDLSEENIKVFMELNGDLEVGLYVLDNKAYINQNGDKTYFEITKADDIITNLNGQIGILNPFDENSITKDTLKEAGVDKDGATIIEFSKGSANIVLVLFNGELRKVLYNNEEGMEYIIAYHYQEKAITFPTDLDSYIKK